MAEPRRTSAVNARPATTIAARNGHRFRSPGTAGLSARPKVNAPRTVRVLRMGAVAAECITVASL
ncbi:hypothetical protein [Streptomyces sp. NPDC096132]|uniref:hypothetical protein n=1 Tax=Streptomyces sp. NPDC096132 TaxID=3366075 RepID=UPI0038076F72